MKFKLILCLALILSGGLFGCSTNPPTAETKVFDYSNGDSPVTDGLVLTGLGKSFSIRTAADSWLALVQKVKPTFAWNGCDLMWVENETNGQPEFILDEAYVYQPTNQPRQWILAGDERAGKNWQGEEWWHQFSCSCLHAVASLHDVVPLVDNDAGERGNYAVALAANRKFGTVYEIGWQREMCEGTAHADYARRIYVFKDNASRWYFLGEGPEEGWARGGGNNLKSWVVWDNSKTNELPVQIHFLSQDTQSEYTAGVDDTPCLTTCKEYVMSGKFPARYRETDERSYLLAEKDDTFEKIVQRLGYFLPGWEYYPEQVRQETLKRQILEMWRNALIRLNPQVSITGSIKTGTRIELLTNQEFQKLNPAKE